ncbi:LolA family protein [Zafaria cholistanensis]|nr:hypothetical protein [Zafaria cholistanensis]
MKPVVLKKWMPAAAVPAIIAAYALASPLTAAAQDLPDKSPEQVIAMMASSEGAAFSGHLRKTANLGLPQLPGQDGHSQPGAPPSDAPTDAPPEGGYAHLAEKLALLSGTHEARVFSGGPDRMRVQVMDGTDEENYILNGTSYWRYSSAENTAVHTTLPQPPSEAKQEAKRHWYGESAGEPPTPEQIAGKLVDEAEPSTNFTVEEGETVAGRAVYTLRLTPKPEEQTLVADVAIGVDAETGVPLAVTVGAVDQADPALDLEYTSFTPQAPDAALFDFEPPAGATVEERPAPGTGPEDGDRKHGCGAGEGANGEPSDGTAGQGVVMDGEGWDTVVRVPSECVPAELKDPALLGQLATEVDGGRLLHTSLVNVLVADDGRVFAGSVPTERLQAVAGQE